MIWVLSGPECSGKTSLAKGLHKHLGWPLVPELARCYLNERYAEFGNHHYRPSDLLTLAAMQERIEAQLGSDTDAILDTDLLTLIVWWQDKYGPVPRPFAAKWQHLAPRRYLLCRPDMPWQSDPQRENPVDRERLFARYEIELSQRQCLFAICQGSKEARLKQALAAMQNLS